MFRIDNIIGREVLDSRGLPTVEAELILNSTYNGRAIVPSGASTGSKEAVELRDKHVSRYHGKGVITAVNHVNYEIKNSLQGLIFSDQFEFEQKLLSLDDSVTKNNLGANAILAVSLAFSRAAAVMQKKPLYIYLAEQLALQSDYEMNLDRLQLPVPLMNLINGGVHADNNVDIQEFMIVPVAAKNFAESVRWGSEILCSLKSLLLQNKLATSVGDEGGFAPNLNSNEQAIEMLLTAIEKAGFSSGSDVYLALDIAASELFNNKYYTLANKKYTSQQLQDYLVSLVKQYPIISIEDGLFENDWQGWQQLTTKLSDKVQLVGDDLFVTRTKLLQQGIRQKIANSILIKLNQIGSLTETLDVINLARKNNYNYIISHRSGETEDCFIADLAVATSALFIKTGSICRSERVAKYNQLLRIEEELGNNATYAGKIVAKNFTKFS